MNPPNKKNNDEKSHLRQEYVIRETVVTKLMVPFIQMFAIYVVCHGETAPGGGFQGGVIFGSSIILYILVYGLEKGKAKIPTSINDIMGALGVLIFAGIGLWALAAGGNFLEYYALPLGDPHFASHMGILAVEIAIGITVAAIMITLFCETIRRDDDD